MKVSTKISLGAGALLVQVVGISAYQVNQIENVASLSRSIALDHFSAARGALDLLQAHRIVDESARKFVITGDADYLAKIAEADRAIRKKTTPLLTLQISPAERRALSGIIKARNARARFSDRGISADSQRKSDREAWFAAFAAQHVRVHREARTLLRASRAAIAQEVSRAALATRQARQVSWAIATIALMITVLVVWLIIRAVKRPLKNLTEATHAVSAGKFSLQIESTRNDEFSTLTRAFNAMVQRLGELDELKQGFLSHISHELKTPLVAMQETQELLLEELAGPLTAKQRRLLTLNIDGHKRLSSMIDKVLDLSRIEAGATYDLEERSLAELAQTSVDVFEAYAREQAVKITLSAPKRPILLHCDGNRIIQVFQNLIENAIRFSPTGSTIRIDLADESEISRLPAPARARLREESPGTEFALIVVSDSGPGIVESVKEKIFERFYQSDQPQRQNRRGIGLGLAICREIVEAHHGSIWVTRSTECGAAFCVCIPRRWSPVAQEEEMPAQEDSTITDSTINDSETLSHAPNAKQHTP